MCVSVCVCVSVSVRVSVCVCVRLCGGGARVCVMSHSTFKGKEDAEIFTTHVFCHFF